MTNPEGLPAALRVLVFGATGSIGRATVQVLVDSGFHVTCCRRRAKRRPNLSSSEDNSLQLPNVRWRSGDITDPSSIEKDIFRGEHFDIIISCLASRTGASKDAWEIDYRAHHHILNCAIQSGTKHFILLSAICVQKPSLEFQRAKLAFEKELSRSGLVYSIVRPTAFFKSLSGQVERVLKGRPYLVFGDGRMTSCKPISDFDLARYLISCIHDQSKWNCILPIGGPGAAITPLEQGLYLFSRLNRKPRIKRIPISLMILICAFLSALGRLHWRLRDKAELAKIALYYATESMLVLNATTHQYDPDSTPSTGSDTLFDHYDRIISGEVRHRRSEHSVF